MWHYKLLYHEACVIQLISFHNLPEYLILHTLSSYICALQQVNFKIRDVENDVSRGQPHTFPSPPVIRLNDQVLQSPIGPLQDPVTWYGINYAGTQMTQWDFQNKGKSDWTGTSSFVLEVPLRHLRPSVIYSVPCDRILQRAY